MEKCKPTFSHSGLSGIRQNTIFCSQSTGMSDSGQAGMTFLWGLWLLIFLAGPAHSQLTWDGCADLTMDEFQEVLLARGDQILELDIARDGRVFFGERAGPIRMYDPEGGAVLDLITVDVNHTDGAWGNHRGIIGLVLDQDFDNTGWIYVTYHNVSTELDPVSGHPWYRISRFTYGDGAIDPLSEKILLEFPYNLQGSHSGGSLTWGKNGELYITTGSNSNAGCGVTIRENDEKCNSLRTSANTNSLHGKIIRIIPLRFADSETPEPGTGSTYDIPDGNMADALKVAMQWTAEDLTKVRPEIFSMGHRQPYSIQYDWQTECVMIAENSPGSRGYSFTAEGDIVPGPVGRDEFNLICSPGNYGWPMFEGDNQAHNWYNFETMEPGLMFDADNPLNTSVFNTGVQQLPPARPSLIQYGKLTIENQVEGWSDPPGKITPITGPKYYYNGALESAVKMPPHLNGKWIITDFFKRFLRAATVVDDHVITRVDELVEPGTLSGMIDVKLGPDGALYYSDFGVHQESNYEGAIYRLEYTGDCHPDTPIGVSQHGQAIHKPEVLFDGTHLEVTGAPITSLIVFNIAGEKIHHYLPHQGQLKFAINSRSRLYSGVYLVSLETRAGSFSYKLIIP